MLAKLKRYLTEDEELNKKLFKILGIGGICVSIASFLDCLITADIPSAFMNAAAAALAILLLYWVDRTGRYVIGYVIVDIAVFMALFAMLFFSGGGMDGSLPYFFSFALMFTFLMFEGRLLAVMEIVLSAFYMGVIFISLRYPRLVESAGDSRALRNERIIGIFMPAYAMGLIFLMYIREYRKQKRIADEANLAKSRFLANMSHEIRTPVNAVLGFNEIILRTSSDQTAKEYAGYIDQSGHHLLSVINEILDFSQMDSGRSELIPEDFSLRELADELGVTMSILAQQKALAYEIDYDENIHDGVNGDREKIIRILTNLLSNAFKYTNEGSVLLHIRQAGEEAGVQKIRFAVEDTGIGIRASEINDLFRAYERADIMKNRGIEGTGLGLAITEQLLHLMGSSVHVDSTYGKGSTFSFELELPEAEYPEAYEKPEEKTTAFSAPGARILVVDDDEMNRRLMDSFLKMLDIPADFAESGEECLKILEACDYHLVLMDYMMPGMDGADTVTRIRAAEAKTGAHTPVVVLTADVAGQIERELKEKGFDDYLSKPVSFETLQRALLKYIPEELVTDAAEEEKSALTEDKIAGCREMLEKYDIDPEEGLRITDGDFGQYLRIAGFFTENAVPDMEKARTALQSGDMDELRIAMHSLKSKAGSVGAAELKDLAEKLEARCGKNDTGYVSSGLSLVLLEWERCTEGLMLLCDKENAAAGNCENEAAAGENAAEPKTFEDMAEELAECLELCEGKQAKVYAERLKGTEKGRKHVHELDEIETMIDDMEFENAMSLLQEADRWE